MIGQLIAVLSCDWLSEDRPRRVPLGGEVGGSRHHPARPQQGTEVRHKVFLITFYFFIFSVILLLESISGTPSLRIGSTLASAVEQSTFQVTED